MHLKPYVRTVRMVKSYMVIQYKLEIQRGPDENQILYDWHCVFPS